MTQLVSLGEILRELRNGTTAVQSADASGLPVTRIETIRDGTIDPDRVRYVSLSADEVTRWRLIPGDILFSHINSVEHIGKSAIYNGTPETLIHGMNLMLLRPNPNLVMPDYLHAVLNAPRIRRHFRSVCKKAVNQASLNQKDIRNLVVPLPSQSEQRRIVDILNRAASIRRLREQAQVKAREVIPVLFVDMFGHPSTNPRGWPISHIGEVLESADYGSSSRANDDPSGTPLIRMSNVDLEGNLKLDDLKYLPGAPADYEKFALAPGDVLFNRTNSKELVGKTGLWRGEFNAVVASYFIRLRVKRDRLDPHYLWAFMNSRFMKRRLFETARGAIGQANINSKELKAFPMPLPPPSLQLQFAGRLAELEAVIRLGGDAARCAAQLSQSLTHQVFS